jgi:SAM-dependent methyltransferase
MLKRPDRGRRAAGELRAWVYDRALLGLTTDWYRQVLSRLPDGAVMLDVGIGTGGALARCADLVRAKGIRVVGLDIDRDYLARCDRTIARAGLSGHVSTILRSVYDYRAGTPFDAAYFSASLMLMPDPVGAIERVAAQLAPGGRIFFTQTFEQRRSPVMERIKPVARYVTTIDFGQVTYEPGFKRVIARSGLELVEFATMSATRRAERRLAVARPVA